MLSSGERQKLQANVFPAVGRGGRQAGVVREFFLITFFSFLSSWARLIKLGPYFFALSGRHKIVLHKAGGVTRFKDPPFIFVNCMIW